MVRHAAADPLSLVPDPGFAEELFGLDAELPDDLPGFSVDELFDDYLSVLGTAQLRAGSLSSVERCHSQTASPGHSGAAVQDSNGQLGRTTSSESRWPDAANSPGSSGHVWTAGSSEDSGRLSSPLHAPFYGASSMKPQSSQAALGSLPPVIQLPQNDQSLQASDRMSPALSLEIPLLDFSEIFSQQELHPSQAAPEMHWLGSVNPPLARQEKDAEHYNGYILPLGANMGGLNGIGDGGFGAQSANPAIQADTWLPAMGLTASGGPEQQSQADKPAPDALQAQWNPGQAESHRPEGLVSDCQDADDLDLHSEEEEDETGAKKPRRRRNRSERQQMLNKLAQQRYRERKRQKALDVERAAAALSSKMEGYEIVQRKHKMLSEKKRALQQVLAERDAELVRLTADAAAVPAAASADSWPANGAMFQAEEADHLSLMLHEKVFQLREHLQGHGLLAAHDAAAAALALPSVAARRLEGLVEEISSLSIRAQRLEGVDVWHLVVRTMPRSGCGSGCSCFICRNKETWGDVARSLKLSAEQCRKLIHIRDQYSKKLEAVFQERRRLNLEAVTAMLPQDRGGSAVRLRSEGQVFLGFYQRARHSAKLTDVLDSLKQNLRTEQRAASEIDYITFRRILTPLQGALFILEAYPLKCDALALSHTVQQLYGNSLRHAQIQLGGVGFQGA